MKATYNEVVELVLQAMNDWRLSDREKGYNELQSEAIVSCGWTVEEFNTRVEKDLKEIGDKLRSQSF